jgi:hypothetical protein
MGELVTRQVRARRVRVWMDVKSGSATSTLIRDGSDVPGTTYTKRATGGVELSYKYPARGKEPEEHAFALRITGDAIGGTPGTPLRPEEFKQLLSEAGIELEFEEETSDEPEPEPKP